MQEYIKRADQYGHRVHLNYNGDETFKTVFGGSLTLFSRFLILVYLSLLINAVISRSRSNITEMYKYKNLVFDEELIKVTPENLEIAIVINYSPDQRMIKVENIYQYFSVKLVQLTTKVHKINAEYPDGIERIFEYKQL